MIIPLLNIAITARRRLLLLLRDDAVPHSGETAAPRRHGLGSPTMTGRRAPARGHAVDQPAAPSHPPATLWRQDTQEVGATAVRLGGGLLWVRHDHTAWMLHRNALRTPAGRHFVGGATARSH